MVKVYDAIRVVLRRYVDSGEVPLDTFGLEDVAVAEEDLEDGDVLLRTMYLSVDPYMRPLMKYNPPGKHYAPSYEPGKPLYGYGVGCVVSTRNPNFQENDIIVGNPVPWSTYAIIKKDALEKGFRKVPDVDLPLSYYLGVLGMPGLTAYSGLKKIAEPKEGETGFVDAAAGAVGQVVGQLLKNVYKCGKVVGSAGSKKKVDLLKDLGYDAAINYKEENEKEAMQKAMPQGLDIHWENVGGPTLDHALELSRKHARFVMCGMISDYDKSEEERYGVKNLFYCVSRCLKLQGMLVFEFEKELGDEFIQNMSRYVKEGKVKPVEDVEVGIENMGKAFLKVMKGENVGKQVVMVGRDPNRQQAPAGAPQGS